MSLKTRQIGGKKKRKQKKSSYKINKKDVLENAEALYSGLNVIVDAFERLVFKYGGLPEIDVDYDSDTYDLADRGLQMFKKFDNPDELRDALMDANKKEYVELLNDLKIKQTVLKDQIKSKIGIEHTRSENLVNTVEDILDSVIKQHDITLDLEMPDLESEEYAAQRRNQQGKGLKILTPNQMLSRLPISLAQLKAGNNSEKLKNEIRQLLYSLYRSKKLTKQIYKSLINFI